MKVYITRYALSTGVRKAEVNKVTGLSLKGDWVKEPGWMNSSLKLGRDCFTTRREALEDAQTRASKEILRLRARVAKLQKLEITPKWNGGE